MIDDEFYIYRTMPVCIVSANSYPIGEGLNKTRGKVRATRKARWFSTVPRGQSEKFALCPSMDGYKRTAL